MPYHDAQNGPPNYLFHNRLTLDGEGFFEDVTNSTGLNENNNRYSFAPAWCDYNADGWPDLYVANDFGRKNLYKNEGGHFRDVALAAGVEDMGPGMSAAWFDYDGDGRPDLYVSNMWTAPGQRLVADSNFSPVAKDGLAEAYRRHTKGNSLYRNRGDGTFEETGSQEKVEMGRWAWSSDGFDFDNDGTPEIYIACGMRHQSFGGRRGQLLLAAGGGEFTAVAVAGARLRKRMERNQSVHPRGLQLERARTERALCPPRRTPLRFFRRVRYRLRRRQPGVCCNRF